MPASGSSTTSPAPCVTISIGFWGNNSSGSSCVRWPASAFVTQRRRTSQTCASECWQRLTHSCLQLCLRHDLRVPRCRLTRYGPRGFSMSSPTAWNLLPMSIHDLSESSSICRQLKSLEITCTFVIAFCCKNWRT